MYVCMCHMMALLADVMAAKQCCATLRALEAGPALFNPCGWLVPLACSQSFFHVDNASRRCCSSGCGHEVWGFLSGGSSASAGRYACQAFATVAFCHDHHVGMELIKHQRRVMRSAIALIRSGCMWVWHPCGSCCGALLHSPHTCSRSQHLLCKREVSVRHTWLGRRTPWTA